MGEDAIMGENAIMGEATIMGEDAIMGEPTIIMGEVEEGTIRGEDHITMVGEYVRDLLS